MKRLFSFLLIFSVFSIVALPFFLNPNFARADYCSCPPGNVCSGNPPTTAENCAGDANECGFNETTGLPICDWVLGEAPGEPVACTPGELVCNFTNCHSNNSGTACCNNLTASINCGDFCTNHQGCSDSNATLPTCDYADCSDWCNYSEASPGDSCCDGSDNVSTCGDEFDLTGNPCTGGDTCSGNVCASATQCCNLITKQIISCGEYSNPITDTPSQSATKADQSAKKDTTAAPAPTTLSNPLGPNTNSVPKLIGNIINGALGIVGSLALLMFIYGGFTWMLAAGNEQAVEKGKNILMWAAIGLVVIFASYSLVSFVINNLTGAAGS